MKLGIILNSRDPETAWNALRLGSEAIGTGFEVKMFLLGSGVEIEKIKDKTFDILKALRKFLDSGGEVLACGTCMGLRHQEAGVCSSSTMAELVKMVWDSDRVVSLG